MEIRSTTEDDWELLRDVRLRALADAPHAFATTLEQALAEPDALWRDWAAARRWGAAAQQTFLAVDDGNAVGLVAAFLEEDMPEHAHLVAMWVDPRLRGRGIGSALVERVAEWARTVGAVAVELWVADWNDAARRLYERLGFRPTGDAQPLPSAPEFTELRMVRGL